LIRALLGALLGAAAAAAALLAFTLLDPAVVLDMDRDVQRPIASGLYPVEIADQQTYAWTSPLTTFTFRDLDRRAPWRCIVRLRGARPPGVASPDVSLGIDGTTLATRAAGAHYEDVELLAPRRDGAGLRLSIGTSPAFVPATDPRQLGVQLDRVMCEPQAGWVLPPRAVLIAVTVSGALFGALFGMLAATVVAASGSVVFAIAIAWLVQTGFAAFMPAYLDDMAALALWIAVPGLALSAVRGHRLSPSARFVVALSAAVLFLKLAALMHPSKSLVDALFHAHRLEWVMDGRYYFTQPMPGGVQFPYAIGLYVVASPFAAIMRDHVMLLRVIVCVFEVLAAGLLYVVVARAWSDKLAGVLAVVCYHLVPLPYIVVGNANLTYAFGHAVSVLAFAVVSVVSFRWRNIGGAVLLFATAALAFLSHVAVFPLLALALLAAGGFYAVSRDSEIRRRGVPVIVVCALAAIVAFGVYYAHFPEVYRTLDRVRSTTAEDAAILPEATPPPALPVSARAVRAVTLGLRDVGIPLILLAGAGLWLRIRQGGDRLNLALAAWGISFVVFVGFRIVAPVDPRLQRYADEFIDRVYYATLPVFVILAATAAATAWRTGGAWRGVAALVLAAAGGIGITSWAAWIR
jgi:hypothetical protein